VTIDAHPDHELIATVKRINPSVDPLSGTVKVTLAFGEEAQPFLREAAFARVRLVMETHENALVIPKDTMIEENGRHYVMVVRQDPAVAGNSETNPRLIAERVEVKTGLEDSNFVEVVSGIDESTLVVTLGQHTLKPGTAVKITNAADEVMSKVNLSAEEALARARDKEVDLDGRRGDRREKLIR
jgi:membrane fusion protein (multidrug efflux system)